MKFNTRKKLFNIRNINTDHHNRNIVKKTNSYNIFYSTNHTLIKKEINKILYLNILQQWYDLIV